MFNLNVIRIYLYIWNISQLSATCEINTEKCTCIQAAPIQVTCNAVSSLLQDLDLNQISVDYKMNSFITIRFENKLYASIKSAKNNITKRITALSFKKCVVRAMTADLFQDMTALRAFDLTGSDLLQIEPYFTHGQGSDLTNLLIHSNKLKQVSLGVFTNLPKLGLLWLYNNEISGIEQHSFDGLASLRILY